MKRRNPQSRRKRRTPRKKRKSRRYTEKMFVDRVWSTMEEQARKNPAIAALHERLSPVFDEIQGLIRRFLQSADEEEEEILNKIRSFRERAILPLLDFLKSLKRPPQPPEGPRPAA